MELIKLENMLFPRIKLCNQMHFTLPDGEDFSQRGLCMCEHMQEMKRRKWLLMSTPKCDLTFKEGKTSANHKHIPVHNTSSLNSSTLTAILQKV